MLGTVENLICFQGDWARAALRDTRMPMMGRLCLSLSVDAVIFLSSNLLAPGGRPPVAGDSSLLSVEPFPCVAFSALFNFNFCWKLWWLATQCWNPRNFVAPRMLFQWTPASDGVATCSTTLSCLKNRALKLSTEVGYSSERKLLVSFTGHLSVSSPKSSDPLSDPIGLEARTFSVDGVNLSFVARVPCLKRKLSAQEFSSERRMTFTKS